MSATLESIRQSLDDIETLKRLSSFALQSLPTPPHPRLSHLNLPPLSAAHLARNLVHEASLKSQSVSLALPPSSLVQKRIHDDLDGANPLSSFYSKLRELRDVHRANTRHAPAVEERERALLDAAFVKTEFSGEEGGGRFLDLLRLFNLFLNVVKPNPKIEYYEYLDGGITSFDSVSANVRGSIKYMEYLKELQEYLVGFAKRVYPLHRIDEHVAMARDRAVKEGKEHLSEILESMPDVDKLLENLGAEGVKKELMKLGMKCGGRPEERAKRLLEAAKGRDIGERGALEAVLKFMLEEVLIEERVATVANVRKKLSQSYAELEAERIAEESVVNMMPTEEVEEVESTIYNPKDVPLGWDGKPIPYWMYKLHGLNHEFKCEICGGASYRGPRAFERHFTEGTHVAGLRCLGIGYSKAFMMVTGIEQAIKLKEKLQKQGKLRQFDGDVEMEFEDGEGNVFNRKTYHDLVRQGLL